MGTHSSPTRPEAEGADQNVGQGGAGNEDLSTAHEQKNGAGPTGLVAKLKEKIFRLFRK